MPDKTITLLDWPPLEEKLRDLGVVALGHPDVTTIFEREHVRDRSLVDRNLTFRGEAAIDATVFNDISDSDDYRVLAPPPKRRPSVNLSPQIELREGEAWIRYRTEAELTGRGRHTLDSLKFSIDGRAGVTLLDYRRHDPEMLVAEAVKEDLLSPRSILRASDLMEITPGDALALATRAQLKASITIPFADIYTNTLTRLAAILDTSRRVAFRMDSRATLTIPLTIEDDFLFIVSRTGDGDVRIAVRKESSHHRGITARVTVSAGLSPPKTIADATAALLASFFHVPLDKLREIAQKTRFDELDEREREIVEMLIEELGLTDEVEQLERIREIIMTIEERAAEAIREVVSQKIAAAFQYEYNRIEESDDFLDVVIRRRSLGAETYRRLVKEAHENVIRGDLTSLLNSIADDSDRYELRHYLGRDRIVSTRSYGFTLGIGDWRFSSKETTKLDETTRSDIDGRRLITFRGLRQHVDRTGSFNESEWKVDFRAGMKGWAVEPRAADFDFGLHFLVEQKIDRFSEKKFLPLLDLATQWRVIAAADAEWALGEVRDLFGRRGVSVTLQTIFEEDHLRRIMPAVDREDTSEISDALAAALPWQAKFPLLMQPRSRAIAYRDIVESMLRGDRRSRPQLHRLAAAVAASLGAPALASLERSAARGTTSSDAIPGSVLAHHGKLPYAWTRFCEGARLFSEALAVGTTHHARIPGIFRELQRMWDHAWYMRALPAYLLVLGDRVETSIGVQRVLRLDWTEGNDNQTLLLTQRDALV